MLRNQIGETVKTQLNKHSALAAISASCPSERKLFVEGCWKGDLGGSRRGN